MSKIEITQKVKYARVIKNGLRVRFVIRKQRVNAAGKSVLMVRVTINSVKGNMFSSGIMVRAEEWNAKEQTILGDENGNEAIKNIQDRMKIAYQDFVVAKRKPIPNDVIAHFSNTEVEDLKWSIEKLAEVQLNDLVLRDRSKATLGRYRRIYRFFSEFSKVHYVEDVRKAHIISFWNFQKAKGQSNDYCNKMIQCLVGLFECAVNNEIIPSNPAKSVKLSWENNLDLTSMTKSELDALKTVELSDKLRNVADSFLFMCYTGLHITDYIQLTDADIKTNQKFKFIEYTRQKTGQVAIIPLHPVASALIRKYGSIRNLPRISGQKQNEYLKIVAERIGTSKNLTNKVARKTFTDMSINQRGMSFESVAGMLGHSSTKFVKVYGKVKHERILSEWKA